MTGILDDIKAYVNKAYTLIYNDYEKCSLKDGLSDDTDTLYRYFRLHLNRGINHYSSRDVLKSIHDLIVTLPKEE